MMFVDMAKNYHNAEQISELEKDNDELVICAKCKCHMVDGGFVDGHFPYETEYNLCHKCNEEV